ncbi:MAG: tRNA pseudouridine(55) synthase TruB [Cyanobacteriota bacterium]|nr:tRNA pseudouridine(55) synthase TruB [Cyanobacteriota bacterium]
MICGFLALDKPAGPSSHSCVAQVRRAYGLKRVGHGGTLDPAVTGVLPIALGPATRLLPYLPGEKGYRATVQLGVRTDTDDLQGTVLSRQLPPAALTPSELETALAAFRGEIQQRPPAFSAVHVQGQRAYALARSGRAVVLAPRRVTLHQLDLRHWDPVSGLLELDVFCSAGTYIRSLARDLGDALGCGAALASLRRTFALGFALSHCVRLEDLAPPPPAPLDPLVVLAHLPRQSLSPTELAGWRCGRTQQAGQDWPSGTAVLLVDPDGKLAGLAEMEENAVLRPRLVVDACG